jgi:outer membrane protein assembly factor BamB
MTDRDWNWNDNWDWLRSSKSGDDSQSSGAHKQTQAKTDQSTRSQTIHRREVLQSIGATVGAGALSNIGDPLPSTTNQTRASTGFDWRQYRIDSHNSGDGTGATVPTSSAGLAWYFSTDGRINSSPAIVNGTIYVGSNDNHLYAIDAATGSQKWSYKTAEDLVARDFIIRKDVSTSPAVSNGTVYFGHADGGLFALDADSGEERWTKDVAYSNLQSPTVHDGVVYVSDISNLLAFDAETGERLWKSETVYGTRGSAWEYAPAVSNGRVFTTTEGTVYAFDAASGEKRWEETVGFYGTTPVATDDRLFVGVGSGLTALDPANGDWIWDHTDFRIESPPAVTDDIVYAAGKGSVNEVHAFDVGDGRKRWSFTPCAQNWAGCGGSDYPHWAIRGVVGDAVFVGEEFGKRIHALNHRAATQDDFDPFKLWQFSACDTISTDVVGSDGTVYFGTEKGNLYALNESGSNGGFGCPLPDEESPGGGGELDLSVQAGTAPPGGTYTLTYQITNTGSTTIGDGNDNSPAVVAGFPGVANEGGIPDGGAVDGGGWYAWTIDPGETLQANLEVELADDIDPGEYEFTAVATQDQYDEDREYDQASGTVTVAPLGGARQQKLDLAERIDDAATVDSLLTSDPTTLAIQPDREVARRSLDLLEESVTDGTLSRQTAIDAANRLRLGEQLTEDVLQYTGDATVTTDTPEVPTSLNIAQQTAGPLLKVVVSVLLQTKAASKIVSSVSQKLPAGVSISPSQIGGVARDLLDTALKFKEKGNVPSDTPDTTQPADLLADLQPEVATIVEKIETAGDISVDAVLSTIDTVIQPLIDVTAGTLRVFLEHIALFGAVPEGIDPGLAGAVTNLHSALRPASIASGGLAGSQSQAEEARSQAVDDLGQTAVEAADVLDGFGTQEKLRDSTELAVNILKLEPEEIDITTIVEFARGQITEVPYGEALDLGLGIGFMLNLYASHSNAHTGIINGEVR